MAKANELEPAVLAGQLIVGGFEGATLTPRFAAALARGHRGGAILFRRNLPSIDETFALCTSIARGAPAELPPFLGVDQEGGRVTRLPAPALTLPPMRLLARIGDVDLIERAARAVATELGALGFNLNFAPILDVDSNPANPIIGDRAFGTEPVGAARFALAFARGQESAGVMACGKHFPGHGDTTTDSHLELPVVAHPRARLEAVEIPPFAEAARAGISTMMTAHVVYEGLDPGVPATLSSRICTGLLRGELGYAGVLFSDDLEMKAIAARMRMEDAALDAVCAGCDVLLVCKDEDAQDRVHAALTRAIETDAAFRARAVESVDRALETRRRFPPRPAATLGEARSAVGSAASRAILAEIQERGAAS